MIKKTLVIKFVYWLGYSIGYTKAMLKWCPWSPWTIAKLNMAWNHYIKTTMYEGRVEVDREFRIKQGTRYEGNFPLESFVEHREYLFFCKQITKKEWLKIIFMPFSCGKTFVYPTWKIKLWLFGGMSE
jgi:hypothetical protein